MKRRLLASILLALLACGGSKRGPAPPGGGGEVAGGGGGGDGTPGDPQLAARRAFVDPGGMWMPRQMTLPVHAKNLAAMGVAIEAAALADPTRAPLDAVVSLGGCTGSFVSPEGLIITNHHCVQTALQVNATPEHNYVEDGFLAKDRAGEKSAGPAQRVYVTQKSSDVTDQMMGGIADIADPGKRAKELETRQKAMVAACEKGRAAIRCDVESFYRGAEWQLIEKLEIRDVRLVHAPRRSIGNYGGEIDNWAWPRHTGDYSFLRAYVGKDGQPADPSPDNVPYQPKSWLRIARDPLTESDFVMVAGYPGSTERVTTYSEVQFDVDWTMPQRIVLLQKVYDGLEAMQRQGGMRAIKAGFFKQFVQNGLENTQGTLAGLKRGDTLATKQALDGKVRAWAARPGNEAYARAIDELETTFVEERATAAPDAVLASAVGAPTMFALANLLVRMAEERARPDAARKAGFQDRDLPDLIAAMQQATSQFDPEIDRMFLRILFERALELPAAERPWLATVLAAGKGDTVDQALVDRRLGEWYGKTKLTDEKVRLQLLTKGTTKQIAASKDPMLRAALALRPALRAFEDKKEAREGARVLLAPKYAIAMREALDGALAPDANGTLRVTYGTVKRRGEGAPFTVVSEIPKKDKGEEPFDAPSPLLDAVKRKTWGPYADPTLGEVPVDFLSDVDTTGGNSGSPTLNHKGELVGLLFDGTIESVSSDVVFDPVITRSIHCDIRYALWVMDLIDGADHLLTEMGVTPSLP